MDCTRFDSTSANGRLALFVIGARKQVTPVSPDSDWRVRPGDTVVSIVGGGRTKPSRPDQ